MPSDEADLLHVAPENSYLPVRTGGGLEGWVWSRNVTVDSTRESTALGIPVYDRNEWKHWIDENGNCRNARAEALIRDAVGPVQFRDARECEIVGGVWLDPFSGDTMRAPSARSSAASAEGVVGVFWRSGSRARRADPQDGTLPIPVPTIESIAQEYQVVGDPHAHVMVKGYGFRESSVIRWDGTALPTVAETSPFGTLTAQILPTALDERSK